MDDKKKLATALMLGVALGAGGAIGGEALTEKQPAPLEKSAVIDKVDDAVHAPKKELQTAQEQLKAEIKKARDTVKPDADQAVRLELAHAIEAFREASPDQLPAARERLAAAYAAVPK